MNTPLPEAMVLLNALQTHAHAPVPCVCVQVIASRGSVPRHAGAMMLVSAHTVTGTIGGGHLEHIAITQAREQLNTTNRSNQTAPIEQEYPLGAALGQCCGGAMTLRFEVLNPTNTQSSLILQSLIAALTQHTQTFKTLFLFGAGHVAQALVPLLAALPLRVVWADARDAVNIHQSTFPTGLPPQVSTVISDTLEAELCAAQTGDLALVMTHSHALDQALTQAALRTTQLAYVGLIGSATKRRLFEQRLGQQGFIQADFNRLTCPIGVTSPTTAHSKLPAVIALQVAAQLTGYV